jgi:ATP-dependent Clp protease adapter protein ClpS
MQMPQRKKPISSAAPKLTPKRKSITRPTKEKIERQFDTAGVCKICNDTGIIETKGMAFECSCIKKRDESFENMKNNMKLFARELIDEIIGEEFGMTPEDISEIKMDIAEQKEHERKTKAKEKELLKKMVMLPIEGSKKNLIYESSHFNDSPGYAVFIYNNSITKLQDVVKVLTETCDVDQNQAMKIAHFINDKGAAMISIKENLEDAENICKAFAAYGIQSEYIKH